MRTGGLIRTGLGTQKLSLALVMLAGYHLTPNFNYFAAALNAVIKFTLACTRPSETFEMSEFALQINVGVCVLGLQSDIPSR